MAGYSITNQLKYKSNAHTYIYILYTGSKHFSHHFKMTYTYLQCPPVAAPGPTEQHDFGPDKSRTDYNCCRAGSLVKGEQQYIYIFDSFRNHYSREHIYTSFYICIYICTN